MTAQVELPVSRPTHVEPGSSARLAILLSTLVCPGAGQFAQRRWAPGVLYLVGFCACLGLALWAVIVPLLVNLRIAMDFAEKGGSTAFQAISLPKVLVWFGLTVMVYLVALVDVMAYARRQARRRLAARRNNLEPL